MVTNRGKMRVDVWSDVMCPYCYMGSRMLQTALAEFPYRDEVEVVWRSYQLEPTLKTDPKSDLYQLLGRKGYDRQTIERAHEELRQKGRSLGIEFRFETVVVGNTFNSHRLSHFAKGYGKQDVVHEALFRAHFVDGRNVDDHAVLVALGEDAGLDRAEVAHALRSDACADAVRADMEEARDLGIEAVPHFMFDRDLEVVGAEGVVLLLRTLEQAFQSWNERS